MTQTEKIIREVLEASEKATARPWEFDPPKHLTAWYRAKVAEFCDTCGLFITELTNKLPCPPWLPTGEGDTKTNRALEAGELETLKDISVLLNLGGESLKKEAIELIEQLIQKREGQTK